MPAALNVDREPERAGEPQGEPKREPKREPEREPERESRRERKASLLIYWGSAEAKHWHRHVGF